MCSKDWSTKREKRPVFDILSTVKKSQKRSAPQVPSEPPFKLYVPPSADVDEDIDKENIPVSYETQFSRNSVSQHTTTEISVPKRKSTDPYQNVIADIDKDDEESITRRDSLYIQQLLSSQSHSRSSTASGTNRISDLDENTSFMTGRRDTADMKLLLGIQELIDKASESTTLCLCLSTFNGESTPFLKQTQNKYYTAVTLVGDSLTWSFCEVGYFSLNNAHNPSKQEYMSSKAAPVSGTNSDLQEGLHNKRRERLTKCSLPFATPSQSQLSECKENTEKRDSC